MLRKRNLPSEESTTRQKVADFFELDISNVGVETQPDTFSINIDGNPVAQTIYKSMNKFGNGTRPGSYNFKNEILVFWNGKKVQAA